MSKAKNTANLDLARLLRVKTRQESVRWGPAYQPSIRAVRGEAPNMSGAGTLPATALQRQIHAHSWPEKVAISLALYANPFELHEQHVYYSTPTLHPLAFHPQYASLKWPQTDGTFLLAEKLGVERWHPKVWKPAMSRAEGTRSEQLSHSTDGEWRIGFYIGDFILYLRDADGRSHMKFWEVKQSRDDHGRPGGLAIRRYNKAALQRTEARGMVCAAYAAQLETTIVEFCLDDVPSSLAAALVSLCRAQGYDFKLPDTAVVELINAFKEGIGKDIPARTIARQLLSSDDAVIQAKILLEHAVWQRKVRVDLFEPLAWDMPLLPEREDVLVRYSTFFAR